MMNAWPLGASLDVCLQCLNVVLVDCLGIHSSHLGGKGKVSTKNPRKGVPAPHVPAVGQSLRMVETAVVVWLVQCVWTVP